MARKPKDNGGYGKNKSIAVSPVPGQPNHPVSQNGHAGTQAPRRRTKGELKEKLTTDPTRDYQTSRFSYYGELFVQNLPLWRLWTARMMLTSDPIVNFSLNIRNAALMAADVTVKGSRPEVASWVKKQWDYLWNRHRPKLVSAKKWGFAALQPLWKNGADGKLDLCGLKDFAPEDARALQQGNKLCGSRVKGFPIYFPQALWLSFGPEFGNVYGVAVTRRQYPAWYEKWMERGAKRLQQLRMIKDAYIGDIFWYPPNMTIELPGGKKLSWKDMVREIGENRYSGGALTLPRFRDNLGNELTGYTPPQQVPGATEIFQWVEHCDEGILYGADIPFEVVQAADTGSGFSGRSIPFLVLLNVCNNELVEIVQQVDEQIIRPVAWLNYGGDPDYTIEPKNLVESFSADVSGSPLAGSAIGGEGGRAPIPQPGAEGQRGVPQAVSQQYDETAHELKALRPLPPKLHQYSCLMFRLPGDLSYEVRQLGDLILSEDLADDGRELDPHITIKYGLHTDDPEEVRQAIQDQAPIAIQIGSASYFAGAAGTDSEPPGADVVKLDINSESLHGLNKLVSDKLQHTDTYPDYKPHVTIAYVKRGLGEFYAKRLNVLEGKTAVFDRAIFSDKTRQWHPIRLTGTAQFSEVDSTEQFAEVSEYLSRLRKLIGKGMDAAVKRVTAVARNVRGLSPTRSFGELAAVMESAIRGLTKLLGADLTADMLPSAITGTVDLYSRLPPLPSQPIAAGPPSVVPSPLTEVAEAHLPVIEAAVKTLEEAPVAVGANYLETAELVKSGAFAITGDMTEKAVEDVKEQLTKVIAEGKSQKEFIEVVADRLEKEGNPLSPPHIENVFRTNTMAAYGDAQYRAVTTDPMVMDAFPYVLRSATRDARVRKEHWALEKLGLNGTAVYRVDDPVWQEFRAPWGYNCRCRDTYLTVDQAARKGVKEAQAWIERAKAMAQGRGGSFYQYLGDTAPSTGEHVAHPDFHVDPEFQRDYGTEPASSTAAE